MVRVGNGVCSLRRWCALAWACLSLAGAPALSAQAPAPAPAPSEAIPPITVQIEPPPVSIASPAIARPGPLGVQATKGKPIVAEIVTENLQNSTGGNLITQSTTSVVFRDAQGRIRRESELLLPGVPGLRGGIVEKFITIIDPQRGCGWVLDPQRKVAHRFRLDAPPPSYLARLNAQGNGAQPLAPDSKESDSGAKAASMAGAETLRSQPRRFSTQIGLSQDAAADQPNGNDEAGVEPRQDAAPGAVAKRSRPFQVASNPVRTESLGEQMILGYRAHGTRVITTLQPGEIGNDRPIDIVSEQWFSPDLELVMRSSHHDPWGGEFTTAITKIRRGEQPPELFTVPAPYKTIDADKEQERHILVDGRETTVTSSGGSE